jgi:hypothetical protein
VLFELREVLFELREVLFELREALFELREVLFELREVLFELREVLFALREVIFPPGSRPASAATGPGVASCPARPLVRGSSRRASRPHPGGPPGSACSLPASRSRHDSSRSGAPTRTGAHHDELGDPPGLRGIGHAPVFQTDHW